MMKVKINGDMINDTLKCVLQTEEESKVSHHRSPNMVHTDCPSHLKAFHQVRIHSMWFYSLSVGCLSDVF